MRRFDKLSRAALALLLPAAALLLTSAMPLDEYLAISEPLYAAANAEAPHLTEAKVSHTLMPITADNPELEWLRVVTPEGREAQMVLTCVLLNHKKLDMWAPTDTFRLPKESGVWVTLPADWHRRADQFAGLDSIEAQRRMVEILGLPPGSGYDTVVEVYLDTAGVFRPAHDPTISTTTAGIEFPAWADSDYRIGVTNFREWYAYNLVMAYEDESPCPWTQLGYTYDWHPGAPREGLSEYIGSYGTLARVKTRQSAWDFIRRITAR